MRRLLISCSVVAVVTSLTACQQSQPSVVTATQRAHALLTTAQTGMTNRYAKPPTVQFSDQLYAPQLSSKDIEMPAWYSASINFDARGYGLDKVLADVLMPHDVTSRFLDSVDATVLVTLRYQGQVGGLLEALARETGLSFAVDGRLVSWSRFQVAEFDVAFLAGTTNFFLGDGDDGGSTSAGGTQSAGQPQQMGYTSSNNRQYLNFSNEQLSVWDDLKYALGLLLSADGQLAINQSSTSVLVRDYPQNVKQVAQYLTRQNQRLTRQIAVDVQVLEIAFTDADQFAVDWQLLRQAANWQGSLAATGQLFSGLADSTGGVLQWQRTTGDLAGSSVLVEALQQQGVVQVSNHPRLLSLNNQIAKIVLEDNATYLASAGTTNTANVGSTDVLIPGVITTGFELYVLPKVSNDAVILQISTSLSDLQAIDEVRSGDMLIQTPHTNRKSFFMKAMVGHGETLLLSGLKNDRQETRGEQSFGSWLFGGGSKNTQQSSEMLLLITPHIIDRKHS